MWLLSDYAQQLHPTSFCCFHAAIRKLHLSQKGDGTRWMFPQKLLCGTLVTVVISQFFCSGFVCRILLFVLLADTRSEGGDQVSSRCIRYAFAVFSVDKCKDFSAFVYSGTVVLQEFGHKSK